MSLRTMVLAVIAFELIAAGCAVGNFVTGAPSDRSKSPVSALLKRRCVGCHEVPDPASMSATAWRSSLERMKLRMRLPASEWDSLAAMTSRDVHP